MTGTNTLSARPPLLASLFAGPLFLVATALRLFFETVPDAVPFALKDAIIVGPLIAIASVIGFVLAVIPNYLGTVLMTHLGEADEIFESPGVWIAAGGLMGAMLAWPFVVRASEVVPLAMTGAACALICWKNRE